VLSKQLLPSGLRRDSHSLGQAPCLRNHKEKSAFPVANTADNYNQLLDQEIAKLQPHDGVQSGSREDRPSIGAEATFKTQNSSI